jgi:hypothetical protein
MCMWGGWGGGGGGGVGESERDLLCTLPTGPLTAPAITTHCAPLMRGTSTAGSVAWLASSMTTMRKILHTNRQATNMV